MGAADIAAIAGDSGFLVALTVAAAAGFMRGFVGVGSGMLMAPVFAIVFGPLQTVAIIILIESVVTAQLLPGVRSQINWRRVVLPMGVAAALCMPLGTGLLLSLDPRSMTRVIGLVVIVFVTLLMTGWRYRGPQPMVATLAVGAASGVLMAATSLGNPPVMLYLLSGPDDAATNRANFTGYFCVTLAALLAMMLLRGLIPLAAVIRASLLLPLFAVSAWAGARYFDPAREKLYRGLALGVLLCSALVALLR